LGFLLYDAGFDVWMGNSRGNVYSTNHTTLSPTDPAFWEFSFDEMAKYDLPTQVNYVLSQTDDSNIVYIGHSQGTLQAFIAFQNESIAERISLYVALAPIAYLGNISGALRKLADLPDKLIYKMFGDLEFPSNITKSHLEFGTLCSNDLALCTDFFCTIYGCDPQNWNHSRYGVVATHNPAGSSVKNMIHFAQMVRSDKYQAYDYGTIGNLEHYHTPNPPQYNLSLVLAKSIAIFHGGNDVLADPDDVAVLLKDLPQESIIYTNYQANYSHNDFTWGLNAHALIYPSIISLAKNATANL